MKLQTANSALLSARCQHRTSSGRQCRLSASDAHSALCPQHRAEQQQKASADLYVTLTRNFHDFQTAQGINHSLSNLYELLAKNRISPRRAAVLSYISSLLLRTLPQIDADNAAGIKFPPKNLNAAEPDPGPNSDSNPHPDSTNAWDPDNPEPDPEKKPA